MSEVYLLFFEAVTIDPPEMLGIYATAELAQAGAVEHFNDKTKNPWSGYMLGEWEDGALPLLFKEDSSYDKAGDDSGRYYYYKSCEVIGS